MNGYLVAIVLAGHIFPHHNHFVEVAAVAVDHCFVLTGQQESMLVDWPLASAEVAVVEAALLHLKLPKQGVVPLRLEEVGALEGELELTADEEGHSVAVAR